jgi:hypothetical protein
MEYRFSRLLFLLLCAILLASSSTLAQEERITSYEVEIQVNTDRSITVREDIFVIVAGNIIKRGITRGLPKKRTFFNGRTSYIRYNIKRVLRDGKAESYHTKTQNGEEVLYLGKQDVFLEPGEYHYTIEYDVPNQVEQLKEIDEIYWNAIGTDVVFEIDKAACIVRLPESGEALQQSCYIGTYGSAEQACVIEELAGGNELRFQTTRPLRPKEGLTIGVGFEKGIVAEPSVVERLGSAILLGISALGLLIYFLVTWNRYGVDPPKPTPYPQFSSPKGYSPSSIGYISREKYDSKKITASIIDLAVKGYLRIEEEEKKTIFIRKKTYHLKRTDRPEEELFPEEDALLNRLFKHGVNEVVIDGDYDSTIKKACEDHKQSILGQHKAFVKEGNNRQFLGVPIVVSLLAVIAAVYMMNRSGTEMDFLGGIILMVVMGGLPAFILYTIFVKRRISSLSWLAPLLFFWLFIGDILNSQGFSAVKGFLYSTFNGASVNTIALFLFIPLMIIAMIVYAYLIKRPTKEKLQLQSEIEGFKMYLEMAEKDQMNLLNPPDRTPEHFEAMLPYAFALGVQHSNFSSSLFLATPACQSLVRRAGRHQNTKFHEG